MTGARMGLALGLIAASLWVLERARGPISETRFTIGETPVTGYALPGADGPAVVIAHGFAGSRQMMQGYAQPLARAGYRVFVFDFLGHGRHPTPMSGDVTAIDGTTRLLMDQTAEVIDAVDAGGSPVALLGHSMATDVLVRVAAQRTDIGPLVLISAFSLEIDATAPQTLLMITGAWEPGLRAFARDSVRMLDETATEGDTITQGPLTRRAEIAPYAEHVSVLHSRAGRAAALDWLDKAYDRTSDQPSPPTGWAILCLLGGLVLLFGPVAQRLPPEPTARTNLPLPRLAAAALLPAIAAPALAVPLNPNVLPVLVADYLALHMAIFGAIQLLLLRIWCIGFGPLSLPALGLLLIWCALFGFALDRYAANFWPTPGRLWIIAAMSLGALPYMLADARLTQGASLPQRIALRGAFLASLGGAVALDFDGLFFLLMIAPVVLLFYLVFGTMGRMAARRGGPLASGLALGLVLAWALGVSFPLFQS